MKTVYIVIAEGFAFYVSYDEEDANKAGKAKIIDLEMGGTILPKVSVQPLQIREA